MTIMSVTHCKENTKHKILKIYIKYNVGGVKRE